MPYCQNCNHCVISTACFKLFFLEIQYVSLMCWFRERTQRCTTSTGKHTYQKVDCVGLTTERRKLSTIQTSIKGRWGAGVYPSMHQARGYILGRWSTTGLMHKVIDKQILAHTYGHTGGRNSQFIWPACLWTMDGKPEHLEKTQTDGEQAKATQAGSGGVRTRDLLDNGRAESCPKNLAMSQQSAKLG